MKEHYGIAYFTHFPFDAPSLPILWLLASPRLRFDSSSVISYNDSSKHSGASRLEPERSISRKASYLLEVIVKRQRNLKPLLFAPI